MSNKRSRVNSIVHPTAVTPAGILTERANEVSTDLISSTNRTSNAEKLTDLWQYKFMFWYDYSS